jgi:hypothetical protein
MHPAVKTPTTANPAMNVLSFLYERRCLRIVGAKWAYMLISPIGRSDFELLHADGQLRNAWTRWLVHGEFLGEFLDLFSSRG